MRESRRKYRRQERRELREELVGKITACFVTLRMSKNLNAEVIRTMKQVLNRLEVLPLLKVMHIKGMVESDSQHMSDGQLNYWWSSLSHFGLAYLPEETMFYVDELYNHQTGSAPKTYPTHPPRKLEKVQVRSSIR